MSKYGVLATENPELAKEWHPTKNGDLSPYNVTIKSGKDVWWLGKCGHEWKATIIKRTNGNGCPYCSGRYTIAGVNDLSTLHPELAKQWNYKKNGELTPKDVQSKSNKKVWWICEKGHEWEAIIADRTSGKGCPVCSGRIVLSGYNDLETICPELAKQWNYSKNGELTPRKVAACSGKNVWWKCDKNHEWKASISDRYKGNGCPYCAGHIAIEGINDLLTEHPELVNEWDYEKNISLNPKKLKSHSNMKVWWVCEKGHSWQATVTARSYGSSCPYCQSELKTSFPEQAIFFYIKKCFQVENRYKIDKTEIDIYLTQNKIGIEYDGMYFHNSTESEKREKKKDSRLKEKGIYLIRIKESNKSCIDGNIIYYVPNHNYTNLDKVIIKLFNIIDKTAGTKYSEIIDVDIDRDRITINNMYRQSQKENSIASLQPDIASEWNYERNGKLLPEMFPCGSNQIIWWKCKKGHEWKAMINNRTKGNGCPFCAGQKVLAGFNDLETVNHDIAIQWHPTKNAPLTPRDVTLNSNKKVWWICEKGHSYEMMIKSKSTGLGCPYCSGRYPIKGENDLATLFPELAKQWNSEKNRDITPQDVKPKSEKKVWWRCEKGHDWIASIANRVKGSNCPYCSGRYAIKGVNDLLTINPELANQWNYERNGELSPQDVKPKSNKKVWWKCKFGHEWEATVCNRSNGRGCPLCKKEHNKK